MAQVKIEDKALIKGLSKTAKKLLKPFKGYQLDDFIHGEIHINQIMVSQD